MFTFEIRVANEKMVRNESVKVNEFQFATLIRVCKTRNKELYEILDGFYDRVTEKTRG